MFAAGNHIESHGSPATRSAGALRRKLAAATILASIAGILAGLYLAPSTQPDPGLATLIRFMALVKAAIAAGAAFLAAWRFGFAIGPSMATGYATAVALMALAPGMIWFQSGLMIASAFFHTGLLLGFGLAAGDGLLQRRK